jgi:hypothetical protein
MTVENAIVSFLVGDFKLFWRLSCLMYCRIRLAYTPPLHPRVIPLVVRIRTLEDKTRGIL